ncbi:MAG TPA: hypothetical protein DEQ74_02760 [Wolbachia sp.]|jgi:hypothetical protein|uniref:hypothetical protein n=1 Tax=Wolbachia endosymbiont of Pentalonia nigronervosa TaxID=1301914 RepID=UPI000EE4D1D4|nr:hypothetical protein [Wolbachia endosymbiont of Pentalonia nigronervosa]MBD0390894.1 hypothetical protein [Wolbachia endosymbiont of Pentalonia nigronervosa]HCE59726.1 hypothetical protein [Wolbachia sp.]
MTGTTDTKNTGINYAIFFEYWKNYSKKVNNFDTEVSEIVKSGNAANFREMVIGEGVVIKSPDGSKSLLHHAVTCEGENRIEMISAVLQYSMNDINHQDENGNTPLMHFLYEAQEKGKYTKKDLKEIIKFLVERGASFEMRNNEEKTADDLITVLVSEGILDEGIDKIINEAEESSHLPNQIKAQLNEHITKNGNPIIAEVAVYGNYAQIKLDSDGAELKISEFLQGDFCKNSGISGFSTFHNDDKGGMHGFLSPNGVRNYTVTDGSYDMTLDWVVGKEKCTITINISEDGVVVIDKDGEIVEDRNGLTDEQLKANKYVTINGLSLFDAINKGRNREQEIEQENMQETDEVDLIASSSHERVRNRKEPLQLDVRYKLTDEKGNPLKKLRYSKGKTSPKVMELSDGETSPKVVDWSDGDTGSGVPSAPILTRQSSRDTDSSLFDSKKINAPEWTAQFHWQKSREVGDNSPTRLLSEDEFQARVNPKNASTPKRTEQSDLRNTDPKLVGQSAKSQYSWVYGQDGSPSTSIIEGDSASPIPDSVDGFLGSFGQNGGKKNAQLNTSTKLDSGFSSPTGNKGIGDRSVGEGDSKLQDRFTKLNMGPSASNAQTEQSDSGVSSPTGNKGIGGQSTLQEFNRELKGKLAEPNMGLKSPSASNAQTEQLDSGLGLSPRAYSNLTIFDPKELEARLLLLKQKQGIKQPFDHILGQMKDGPMRRWMEKKREEAADGNGLEGQSGISKPKNELGQKELPTLQQPTEKDFSMLDLSEKESGLKPTDRSKMTKQTLEYLDIEAPINPAQKQDIKKPFGHILDQMKEGSMRRWMEEQQRKGIPQAADGNGLEGHSGISKPENELGQNGSRVSTGQSNEQKGFSHTIGGKLDDESHVSKLMRSKSLVDRGGRGRNTF